MKRLILLIVVLLNVPAFSQVGFNKAEYFFDTDPGPGLANALTVPSGTDIINFTSPVSTASLSPGFHFLALRVQHNDGKWSLMENRGFFISTTTADAANISAAEYFFDADPGVGLGTPIAVTAGPVVNFTVPINASLSAGFHFLAIRTKGADGIWGLFEARGFFISSSSADAANIVAAEYFFDSDPGPGLGTPIIPAPNGAVVNFTTSIPAALSPGFHFLAIRTRGVDGKWGLFESRGFFISTSSADAANIVAAEYFFDVDPGVGLATPIIPAPNGAVVNFTAPIPAALSPGFHFLALRTKDADEKWGLFEKRGFFISTSAANMPILTNAEYFFDTDPGVGAATPLTITTPGDNVSQTFSIPVPLSTPDGQHFLAIRGQDMNGEWGLFEYREFTVSGPVPVTGLHFAAQKMNTDVRLTWFTLTETNTSHFDIERSINGTDFEKIGQQHAVGNSNDRSDYMFTDAFPKKMNYYRLKQADLDGRFIYSEVRKIAFGSDQFNIYPALTEGHVTIEGITEKVRISVFNSSGQRIQTSTTNATPFKMDISKAAAGVYFIVIEKNGELLFSKKIMKE